MAPALMAGQLCWLQIETPVLRSASWMILSMPSNRRFCSTTVGCCISGVPSFCGYVCLTLMCEPFTLFHEHGLCCESHEITLDNQVGVLLAEEKGRSLVVVGGVVGGFSALERHGGGRQAWR